MTTGGSWAPCPCRIVVRAYRRELVASGERVGNLGSNSGTFQVTITADSPVEGLPLRRAGLPRGALVTSLTPGRSGDGALGGHGPAHW